MAATYHPSPAPFAALVDAAAASTPLAASNSLSNSASSPSPAPPQSAKPQNGKEPAGKEKDKEKEKGETPHMFDFTKRKGWSGLLLTQLSGTIMLVFSPGAKVMFASGCVKDYLGWTEGEVVEQSLATLLQEDDVQPFFAHVHHAISTRSELAAYTRFRAKDGRTPLFEVRGHPHFAPSTPPPSSSSSSSAALAAPPPPADEGIYQCFFAMARPYPSKPAALLDSFLDLKIENEHLRQRLAALSNPTPSPPRHPYSLYMSDADAGSSSAMAASRKRSPSESDAPGLGLGIAGVGGGMSMGMGMGMGFGLDGPRKKMKKGWKGDGKQYVCVMCGRTDSPEWRKGPLGAKTLCNACGLRWAKRNSKRKPSEHDILPVAMAGPPSPPMGSETPITIPSVSMLPPPPPASINTAAAAAGANADDVPGGA